MKSSMLMFRGRVYEYRHNYDKAVADYYRSLAMNPSDTDLWFRIGKVYRMAGDSAAADAAVNEGLAALAAEGSEPDAEALVVMGKYAEAAEKALDMVKDSDSPAQRYNVACVYALAGYSDEAMSHLEAALENGFRNFHHIAWDADLDSLRALPEFSALIKRYEEKTKEDRAALKALTEE